MSSASIQAGGAFVRIWAKDSEFRKTLTDAANRMKRFGSSVRILEIAFLTRAMRSLGQTIFSVTAKSFAELGSKIYDATLRTGASAEALQELGFAAEQSGSSLDAVVRSMGFMSRFINQAMNEAANGSTDARDQLAKLGLTIEQIQKLNPGQQFDLLANSLSKVGSDAQLTASVMKVFGKGGAELIPMIRTFRTETADARKELQKLGAVLSSEAIKDADALGDSIKSLSTAFAGLKNQIGASLAKVMKNTIDYISQQVASVNKWIASNRELIAQWTVFVAGTLAAVTAVASLGLAIQATIFALGGLGKALGGFASLLILPFIRGASAVVGLISMVVKASRSFLWLAKLVKIVFILLATLSTISPMTVFLNGIIAATLAVAYFAGALDYIKKTFTGLFKDFKGAIAGFVSQWKDSIAAIVIAIKQGKLDVAWKIVTLTIKLQWMQLTDFMKDTWDLWKQIWVEGFNSILGSTVNWVKAMLKELRPLLDAMLWFTLGGEGSERKRLKKMTPEQRKKELDRAEAILNDPDIADGIKREVAQKTRDAIREIEGLPAQGPVPRAVRAGGGRPGVKPGDVGAPGVQNIPPIDERELNKRVAANAELLAAKEKQAAVDKRIVNTQKELEDLTKKIPQMGILDQVNATQQVQNIKQNLFALKNEAKAAADAVAKLEDKLRNLERIKMADEAKQTLKPPPAELERAKIAAREADPVLRQLQAQRDAAAKDLAAAQRGQLQGRAKLISDLEMQIKKLDDRQKSLAKSHVKAPQEAVKNEKERAAILSKIFDLEQLIAKVKRRPKQAGEGKSLEERIAQQEVAVRQAEKAFNDYHDSMKNAPTAVEQKTIDLLNEEYNKRKKNLDALRAQKGTAGAAEARLREVERGIKARQDALDKQTTAGFKPGGTGEQPNAKAVLDAQVAARAQSKQLQDMKKRLTEAEDAVRQADAAVGDLEDHMKRKGGGDAADKAALGYLEDKLLQRREKMDALRRGITKVKDDIDKGVEEAFAAKPVAAAALDPINRRKQEIDDLKKELDDLNASMKEKTPEEIAKEKKQAKVPEDFKLAVAGTFNPAAAGLMVGAGVQNQILSEAKSAQAVRMRMANDIQLIRRDLGNNKVRFH